MAVFTEVTFDEVATFFRALGLAAPRSVHGIAGGIENANYLVETDGEGYVLTLFEHLTKRDCAPCEGTFETMWRAPGDSRLDLLRHHQRNTMPNFIPA